MPVSPKAAAASTAGANAASDSSGVDVAAWAHLGLHPRLLAEVQRVATDVAKAVSATNGAEHKTTPAEPCRANEATLEELALCVSTVPSALLARVLTRTTSDFADALIDGRCACGVDNQHHASIKKATSTTDSANTAAAGGAAPGTGVTYNSTSGTTAGIWMERNAAAVASSASNTTTPGDAVDPTEENVWQRDASGVGRALFNRPSAVAERRLLLALYALHTLLTATSSGSNVEACGVLVAASSRSAELFAHFFSAMARACGVELVVVEEGQQPTSVPTTSPGAGVASVHARLYVTTMPGLVQWDYLAFLRGATTSTPPSPAADSRTSAKSPAGDAVKRFLVVLAVEDLAYSLYSTNALLEQPNSALAKSVHSDASAGAASFGMRARAGAAGRWAAAEKAWDAILALVLSHADQRATTAPSSGNNNPSSASGAQLRLPYFFWVTLGPLSVLSPLARSRLSRRNRRYYPLSTSSYLSAAEAAVTASGPGTTAPLSTTRLIYLFSTDDKDKEAQLQTILSQTHLFKRILLLTHHKEVRQLYSLIQKWGIYSTSTSGHGDDAASASGSGAGNTSAAAAAATAAAAGTTAGRQFFVLRTDVPDRSANLLLDFTAPSPSTAAAAGAEEASQHGGAALLVAWDSFTSVDLMDVDCIIQYFPPQKSLTDREWTEFIQNLHTTADPEADIEFSLYSNPNNTEKNINMKIKQLQEELGPCGPAASPYRSAARRHAVPTGAETEVARYGAPVTASGTTRCGIRPPTVITMMGPPDLSLTAFFMQQYYYSGSRGALSTSASNASLAAAVQTGGGTTGLPEAVVVSHATAHVPVLNVSATHPWFVPLVCGGPAATAAAATTSSTPPAAASSKGTPAAQANMGTDSKPLTVGTVLRKKIALERCEQMRSGRDVTSAATTLPYMIPCLFPTRATPRSDERPSGDSASASSGAAFPVAPSTSTATSGAGAANAAGKSGSSATTYTAMPVPRSAAAALAAGGATGGNANNNNNNKNNNSNKGGGSKDRSSPAAVTAASAANAEGGKKKMQQKDGNASGGGGGGGDAAGKGKQEEARTQAQNDGNGAGNKTGGGHKRNRSRKKGGDGNGGDANTGGGGGGGGGSA